MAKKIYLEWSEIHECVKILCKGLFLDYPNIDSVMGLPRVGLIPAVMISHELGITYVIHPGKNTLVVDDICDSGVTLKKSPGQFTAVLYHKPHTSIFTPDIWAREHKGHEWLIYPWESSSAEPIQGYLQNQN